MHTVQDSRGFSLSELLAATAVAALCVTISLPDLIAVTRRVALRAAAMRMSHLIMSTQGRAVAMGRHVGIRFAASPAGWKYAVYEDANGNGVSMADIAAGVDPLIDGPRLVTLHSGSAWIGFPAAGVPNPDTGAMMTEVNSSPVKFGSLQLCSFAPADGATPGTVYLTDGLEAIAVRSSPNGALQTLFYDRARAQWTQ